MFSNPRCLRVWVPFVPKELLALFLFVFQVPARVCPQGILGRSCCLGLGAQPSLGVASRRRWDFLSQQFREENLNYKHWEVSLSRALAKPHSARRVGWEGAEPKPIIQSRRERILLSP
jgi:hypothetical protein